MIQPEINYEYFLSHIIEKFGFANAQIINSGYSTRNYILEYADKKFILRIAQDYPVLGVNRIKEIEISRQANIAEFSPKIIYEYHENGVYLIVMEYIPAPAIDLSYCDENLSKIANILYKIHHNMGDFIKNKNHQFNVWHAINLYYEYCTQFEYSKQFPLQKCLEIAQKCQLKFTDKNLIFGHNDCLLGNFIDDGQKLWVIDWEYAGFGTKFFDLAGFACFAPLNPIQEQELLNHYFDGNLNDEIWQNFKIMKLMNYLREAIWFVVASQYIAKPEIDYIGRANEVLNEAITYEKEIL